MNNLIHMNHEDHLIKEPQNISKSDKQIIKKDKDFNPLKKPNSFYKWLFGSFVVTISSTALFFLIKFHDKFKVREK